MSFFFTSPKKLGDIYTKYIYIQNLQHMFVLVMSQKSTKWHQSQPLWKITIFTWRFPHFAPAPPAASRPLSVPPVWRRPWARCPRMGDGENDEPKMGKVNQKTFPDAPDGAGINIYLHRNPHKFMTQFLEVNIPAPWSIWIWKIKNHSVR